MIPKIINYKSKKLQNFVKTIQDVDRNPSDSGALNLLNDMDTNPVLIIEPGEELYRSRIVGAGESKNLGKAPDFYGFDKSSSGVPPREYTRDMRANYKNIPYLYCCTTRYLSIAEVRPRIGAEVSVARIRVNDTLKVFDCSMHPRSKSVKKLSETKENLLNDLSELYAKPVTSEDDTIDYIPTQYIANYIRKLGYDGLAFKSSLDRINHIEIKPINVVIFKYEKCEAIGSNLFQIMDIDYSGEQIDGDMVRYPIDRI